VHARAHLPSLDDKAGMHLECVDTFGGKHRFRYCSWINNSSRMYLLEGVAPALVRALLACAREVYHAALLREPCCAWTRGRRRCLELARAPL
jgi:hypothetical protein